MLTSRRLGKIESLQLAAENRPCLMEGATGDGVAALQALLCDLGYDFPLSFKGKQFDGIFGDETKGNVEAFQRKSGLKVDGIVGGMTLGKLDALIAANNILEDHSEADSLVRRARDRCLSLGRRTCSAE